MIEHNGVTFHDESLRPYGLARRAIRNYYRNECEIVIVSGMPEGVGKSAYVNHALADCQGFQNCHDKDLLKWMYKDNAERTGETPIWDTDYESIKPLIVYPPESVVDWLMTMLEKEERIPMFHWDDGGTWLNSMSYLDPFVISFMQFLPLARSVCGLVVISSPVEDWVLRKLHQAQGIIHAPVIKVSDDATHIWRPRLCKAFRKIRTFAGAKHIPQYQWQDNFSAIMPDSFYRWYMPRRNAYTKLAVARMKASLEKKKLSGFSVAMDEGVLAQVEDSINRTNDKLTEFNEVIAQHT